MGLMMSKNKKKKMKIRLKYKRKMLIKILDKEDHNYSTLP
jgi:hypothetical protein